MKEIAGYKLDKLLGQGTFGETYEATKSGQKVAIKLIREEAMQMGFDLRRFEREVRALQKAVGPNVVKLIDAGSAKLGNETRYFVVLEFLEGEDLAQNFKRANHKYDDSNLRNILIQIVKGLETIHNQNIVHRDLKPANIFLTKENKIKLLDFGLVKMLDYTTLTTAPGKAIGTPMYISPEILRGEVIDFRADFYSLGVLIYHLVTDSQYPFIARTELELYVQVVNNPPTPPTRYNRSLSSELENLILILLSKQPYERTFNHEELIQAIKSIPVYIPQRPSAVSKIKPTEYKKKCFFRLLHTEKGEIEHFIQTGGSIDGFVYPANYLPRYQNSLSAYNQLGLKYLFDPVAYRLAYSSFSQTQGLVNLPYVPDPNSVLAPTDLQTLQSQQAYARKCIDWQNKWDCSILVAPFHFSRDLGSPWIDIDIKLLEESISYVKSENIDKRVYCGLCLGIEPFTVSANRLALLNRYSRARADGYLFYMDNLDERTNNPLQIRAFIDLLRLFQRLKKPVIACRVGTLGLGLMAAGIDGMTTGIASLSSFSEKDLLINRNINYDMSKKYYLQDLLLTVPVPMAEDILSDSRNSHLRCNCKFCKSNVRNLERKAKNHYLQKRINEINQLNHLPDSSKRINWFLQSVKKAIENCETVRRQQIVNIQSSYYSHLRAWLNVFNNLGSN